MAWLLPAIWSLAWDSHTPMGGRWEGRGEPPLPCPRYLWRSYYFPPFKEQKPGEKSHPKQDDSSFQLPLSALCIGDALVLPCRFPIQRLTNCYDLMVCSQANPSFFHSSCTCYGVSCDHSVKDIRKRQKRKHQEF